MKKNYSSWEVELSDFYNLNTEDEKIRFLVGLATLAPSSHNSQPWSFEIISNSIRVFLDKNRRLPESDNNDRQAFISLGCCLENIVLASEYYGYQATLSNEQLHEGVVTVSLEKKAQTNYGESDHLLNFIKKRTTNRNKYEQNLPPAIFFKQLRSLETDDLRISIVTESRDRFLLAEVAVNAGVTAMQNRGFRKELSLYLKSNLTPSHVGMPGFGLGIPTVPSFLISKIAKFINLNFLSRKKDLGLLKFNTPVFLILSTKKDDKKDWVDVGRIYQRIALMSTREGISTAMWAAPIQIKDYYKEIKNILQIEHRPQAFFRLGYCKNPVKHSPRLRLDQVMKKKI